MTQLKHQNLSEIWQRFDVATDAAQALREMTKRKKDKFDLEELLRDHRTDEIDDEDEIAMRDAFDDLLAYYSCVEIAALIGFVPSPLPAEFRASASKVLSNPFVRQYYRKHYPLLLPDMLFSRISGGKALHETVTKGTVPLFFEFLHISSVIDDDPSIEMLLWFLDDGTHRRHHWQSTLALVAKPRRLAGALSKDSRRRNPTETAVDGLPKFLRFCVTLDDLLARSKAFPLFQAAMWHYHSYWFRILRGEVRAKLEAALRAFQSWLWMPAARQLPNDQAEIMRIEAAVALTQVQKVVKRLTGNDYGGALNRQQKEIRRDSVQAVNLLTKQSQGAVKRLGTRR
jgi:hypothetical protein